MSRDFERIAQSDGFLGDNIAAPYRPTFYESTCRNYCCGYAIFTSLVLLLCFGFLYLFPPIGLLLAALTPGVVVLSLARRYYAEQVTEGQMMVTFFECICWMAPLLVWDTVGWSLLIAPRLKENGLCPVCILAYIINFYFFAGFCEEVVKYLALRRIEHSLLARDWRSMLVYGISAGCGFATAENIMYVFTSGFATAVVRAFMSVPLHCTTGAIIGLGIFKGRSEQNRAGCFKGTAVLFVPWIVHGSYDFLLTIAEQPKTGQYAALPYLGAIAFFILGLCYCRNEAVQLSSLHPEFENVHEKIIVSQPPFLGSPGVSQWGRSTEFVCQCCWMCRCCCKSVEGKASVRSAQLSDDAVEPLL